jgi:hypothetical protein
MSVTLTVPVGRPVGASLTVRRFTLALLVALAFVGAGGLVYAVETLCLGLAVRCVQNPADAMVRVVGLAHFAVGWLFLITSPRVRSRAALARLGAATAVGVALCAFFAAYGGTHHPLLALGFYGYFLFHELADETMFFQAYGDAPDATPERRALLAALGRAAALVALTLLTVFFLGHALVGRNAALARLPLAVVVAGPALLMLVTVTAVRGALVRARALHGTVAAFAAAHAPLLTVYAILTVVLTAGSLFGTTGLNLVILIHTAVWIVFTCHQLRRRPAPARGSLWGWVRGTPAGFLALHLGAAAAILGLMLLRVHVCQREGWWSPLLAGRNFCYWGLMHISISLWDWGRR